MVGAGKQQLLGGLERVWPQSPQAPAAQRRWRHKYQEVSATPSEGSGVCGHSPPLCVQLLQSEHLKDQKVMGPSVLFTFKIC